MAREVSCQARGKGIGKSKPDRGIFMQAIILAAGIGKRLRPYTDRTPKCLVPVNGIPIIVNSLDRLAEQKVSRVVIVIGYLGNLVVDRIGHEWKGMKIEYVQNDLYATTNNIYSLWLARRFLNKNTVLLECDVFAIADCWICPCWPDLFSTAAWPSTASHTAHSTGIDPSL